MLITSGWLYDMRLIYTDATWVTKLLKPCRVNTLMSMSHVSPIAIETSVALSLMLSVCSMILAGMHLHMTRGRKGRRERSGRSEEGGGHGRSG